MSPRQASLIIGCTPQHVRTLIRAGNLSAVKIATRDLPFYRYNVSLTEATRYRDQPQRRGYPRGRSRK